MTEKLGDWEDNDRVVRKGRLWCKENKLCLRNVRPSGVVKPCSQGSWRAGRKRQDGVSGKAERRRAGPRNRPPGRRGPGAEEGGPTLRAAPPTTPPPAGDLHLRSPPAAHTPGPVITPGAHSLTAASDAAGPLPPPSHHTPTLTSL